MTDETQEKKKNFFEILFTNETLQWLLFGTILYRKGGVQQGGSSIDTEPPKVPAWIVSKFHFLTTEDEQEYDQILDAFSIEPRDQNVFFVFKNKLVAEGYDEDFLRLMLVNLNRDYLARKDAKKTAILNSATEFISQIYLLDGDYPTQKEFAHEKKFLKKVTTGKWFFFWTRENKGKTLTALIISPFVIAALIYQILNLIFG